MPETKSIVDDFFKLIEIEKQLKKARVVRGKNKSECLLCEDKDKCDKLRCKYEYSYKKAGRRRKMRGEY